MTKTMDRKLLSKQKHEIKYMAHRLGVSAMVVRAAHKQVGRSRRNVIAFIKGYQHGVS